MRVGWELKRWCFWTVVLETTLESPLDGKKSKSVNFKGNQSWLLIEGTDAEAKVPIIWLPDGKSQLIGKDPDAGKDWRQKEKRAAADEMVDSITDSMDMNLSKVWELVEDRGPWCAAFHVVTKHRTQLSNWTTFSNGPHDSTGLYMFYCVKIYLWI